MSTVFQVKRKVFFLFSELNKNIVTLDFKAVSSVHVAAIRGAAVPVCTFLTSTHCAQVNMRELAPTVYGTRGQEGNFLKVIASENMNSPRRGHI